ncbi:hypothetical protein EV174_007033, partial [Coemansia sp. RSA 2320]
HAPRPWPPTRADRPAGRHVVCSLCRAPLPVRAVLPRALSLPRLGAGRAGQHMEGVRKERQPLSCPSAAGFYARVHNRVCHWPALRHGRPCHLDPVACCEAPRPALRLAAPPALRGAVLWNRAHGARVQLPPRATVLLRVLCRNEYAVAAGSAGTCCPEHRCNNPRHAHCTSSLRKKRLYKNI